MNWIISIIVACLWAYLIGHFTMKYTERIPQWVCGPIALVQIVGFILICFSPSFL